MIEVNENQIIIGSKTIVKKYITMVEFSQHKDVRRKIYGAEAKLFGKSKELVKETPYEILSIEIYLVNPTNKIHLVFESDVATKEERNFILDFASDFDQDAPEWIDHEHDPTPV